MNSPRFRRHQGFESEAVCNADLGCGSVQPLHAHRARGTTAQDGSGEAGGGRRGRAHPATPRPTDDATAAAAAMTSEQRPGPPAAHGDVSPGRRAQCGQPIHRPPLGSPRTALWKPGGESAWPLQMKCLADRVLSPYPQALERRCAFIICPHWPQQSFPMSCVTTLWQ